MQVPHFDSAASDWLLKDFTVSQKYYIVHKLYPILKNTLEHFITEAQNWN